MVTRYDMECYDYNDYFMEETQSGDYVLFEDYESLESDYNILRRDYQNLVDKIGELYREA